MVDGDAQSGVERHGIVDVEAVSAGAPKQEAALQAAECVCVKGTALEVKARVEVVLQPRARDRRRVVDLDGRPGAPCDGPPQPGAPSASSFSRSGQKSSCHPDQSRTIAKRGGRSSLCGLGFATPEALPYGAALRRGRPQTEALREPTGTPGAARPGQTPRRTRR